MCGLEEEVQEVPALHRALRQEIYSRKSNDQDSLLWVITENMTARIMEDCLGGDLYSQLKEKVKNNKINLEFDFGKGYSYNWEEHTLHIGLEELEANNLLHEMFHVFQTTQEPISSFKSSMMNREIEAHYAQYLFLQRSAEWTDKNKINMQKANA